MNKKLSTFAKKQVLDSDSKYLRKLILKSIEKRGGGHIGSAMSLVEILRVLYEKFLNIKPSNLKSTNRDRFILSKGHGCLALYAILAKKKFFSEKLLKNACEINSFLGGHPEFKKVPGVEASTGSLGHGLPIAVGFAVASKLLKKKYKVVVLMGDGEINEGSVWESALMASKHKLSNLIAIIDYNKIQSYGPTKEVLDLEPLGMKWKSFGFNVFEVNGHNCDQIFKVLKKCEKSKNKKPNLVICHTIKGKGIPIAENNPFWHHKNNLSMYDIKKLIETIT